ncbi:unnamed protein product [Ceratitis capitata]|uniref:(Mediterranean fruit fly) hypothetical protein n=1 Tax=Ceratitis capitata TaxID=7213 RepID=A0A811UDD5_CERCA|nr:unnamed protein product [Ceratitis capitata]
MVHDMFRRIKMAANFDLDKIESLTTPITLIRPAEVSLQDIEEDYCLSKVTTGNVTLKVIEGNHTSMLDNPILPQIINEMDPRYKMTKISKKLKTGQNDTISYQNSSEAKQFEESYEAPKELSWTNINDQVDFVIPMFLNHLQYMKIEHLNLPDVVESISLSLLVVVSPARLILNNGIAYNLEGVERYGDAFMTYNDKRFYIRFDIKISKLQFEYNYLLEIIPINGYGNVIGTLEDTIIHTNIAIDVKNLNLTLQNFRIVKFRKINVQLDEIQIIRQLSGLILTPITNLFKNRITTTISDGLEKEMELIFNDFNEGDPLQLRTFANRLLAGLTG